LSDDETGSPLERLQKSDDGEGRDDCAALLKRIHAGGARKLAPTAVQKAQSVFDTRAPPSPRNLQLTKRISRNEQLAAMVAKAARQTGNSIEAVRTAHLAGR
jgi:hypothetical protein